MNVPATYTVIVVQNDCIIPTRCTPDEFYRYAEIDKAARRAKISEMHAFTIRQIRETEGMPAEQRLKWIYTGFRKKYGTVPVVSEPDYEIWVNFEKNYTNFFSYPGLKTLIDADPSFWLPEVR
jgi:hypothetical protein